MRMREREIERELESEREREREREREIERKREKKRKTGRKKQIFRNREFSYCESRSTKRKKNSCEIIIMSYRYP